MPRGFDDWPPTFILGQILKPVYLDSALFVLEFRVTILRLLYLYRYQILLIG
jgi:hypothetical protein